VHMWLSFRLQNRKPVTGRDSESLLYILHNQNLLLVSILILSSMSGSIHLMLTLQGIFLQNFRAYWATASLRELNKLKIQLIIHVYESYLRKTVSKRATGGNQSCHDVHWMFTLAQSNRSAAFFCLLVTNSTLTVQDPTRARTADISHCVTLISVQAL